MMDKERNFLHTDKISDIQRTMYRERSSIQKTVSFSAESYWIMEEIYRLAKPKVPKGCYFNTSKVLDLAVKRFLGVKLDGLEAFILGLIESEGVMDEVLFNHGEILNGERPSILCD